MPLPKSSVSPAQQKPSHPRPKRVAGWSRHAFEGFLRRQSETRKAADGKKLAYAFSLAAEAPVFAQALDWAQENNVAFIVDRTMTGRVLGYYTPNTGVVAVASRLFDDHSPQGAALLAAVFTHEIRHAWQEVNGISDFSLGKNSADHYIREALIEADAYAHEQLAHAQYLNNSARNKADADDAEIAAQDRKLADPRFMWEKFKEWYGVRNVVYGEGAMNFIGSLKNIPGAHPRDFNPEFRGYGWAGGRKSIDFTRPEELHRLGKSFAGKNYLDNAPRENFDRIFLSRGLARQFFDAARKPDAIAVALRKKELLDRKREGTLKAGRKVRLP